MITHRQRWSGIGSVAVLVLAACSFAPDYKQPDVPQPPAFKEAAAMAPVATGTPVWQVAQPDAADATRGPWWEGFNDPILNQLEGQVTTANQNLKVAVARYDEAHALARATRASLFPTVSGIAGYGRASPVEPAGASSITDPAIAASEAASTTLRNKERLIGAQLSYEVDVWGRVRNQVSASENEAAATKADLGAVDLSLHAELASDYFALRGADAAIAILDKTIAVYQQAYDLTERRFKGGVSPEADVDQAKTQLENAKAQVSDRRLQRAQLEHAIAVLTGQAPANFALAVAPLTASPLAVEPGLPSVLLQRRPDIAAAALRTEEANANIGVARAAYFPLFNLSGSAGYENTVASAMFDSSSFFWSLGTTAAANIFDAGRLSALSKEARSEYNESAASYRQTVLTAYQEVEDSLSADRWLAQEFINQKNASDAAARALKQANYRYTDGLTTYLEVVVVQTTALTNELAANDVRTRQLAANVDLIKALGGGWQMPVKK